VSTQLTRMKKRRVFVTGAGCITSLGAGLTPNAVAVKSGTHGFRNVSLFSTEGCATNLGGELPPGSLPSAADLGAPTSSHRVSRMLFTAWREAAAQRPGFNPEAGVFGTTSGGMSHGEDFFRGLLSGEDPSRSRDSIREYIPQQAALNLAAALSADWSPIIISNACASGSNAIGHAFHMVAHGICDSVICGGYDPLSQLVFAGFDSLKAMSSTGCRPFSADRDGLLLGEGAAVLFLESEDSLNNKSGASILAEVLGYGSATDNYHLTQPEPGGSGPLASMSNALQDAGIDPTQIDYINAHGTATPFNDSSEGAAILKLFPEVPVSSTKSLTGHTLGAAGAIEAVFCVLALIHGFLPPQSGVEIPDPSIAVRLVNAELSTRAPQRVISNSFGFGGSNASVILGIAS
jgi:3-oxoacyl-[acyl-carrier-protein] synthase II